MIEVSSDSFESEVNQSELPVLVDFWGPRCAPCQALMPFVEKLADQFKDQLKIVKVNSMENRKLCIQLKVMSLPTFLFFRDGREAARKTGEITTGELQAWLIDQLSEQREVLV
jgi:thioredoxin 1